MIIRTYSPALRATCLEIFESNIPKVHSVAEREAFLHWLDNHSHQDYYIMYEKETAVASGGIYYDEQNGEGGLVWGMVRNSEHGKGYGVALTTYRVQQLIEISEAKQLKLSTSQHSIPYYKKMGFREISFQKNGLAPGIDRYDLLLP